MGKVLVWHVTVRLLQNNEGDKHAKTTRRGEGGEGARVS